MIDWTAFLHAFIPLAIGALGFAIAAGGAMGGRIWPLVLGAVIALSGISLTYPGVLP